MKIIRASDNWETSELGSLVVDRGGVQTGPFGSQLHQRDYVDTGTPIITVEHLGDNRILHNNPPCVTDFDRERLKKYSLKPGDIVFSRVGSVDRRAIVKVSENGWLFSGRCLRVRCQPEKIDPRYLSYYLGHESVKSYIKAIAVGATMPSINTKILSQLPVSYPPNLSTQKAIAHILGTLDDKIELNQKINQTLEEIAKVIFKSWFVDFDPVRAKAEGRPTGLSPEISDLFPDELVDSEIGEIPKGWEVKTIQDVAKVTSGKRPPEKENVQSERCPYVVYGGAGPMAFCSEPLNFTKPAIITGRVGTLGKVFYLTDDCWVSDNSILICDAGVYSSLVFYILQSIDMTALNVGSTQPLVTGKDIKNLDLVAPSDSLLHEYKELFDLIKNRQSTANVEIEVLSELRDTLLPKLISGELRIPDAEKVLEEAGI